jgi:hypothetical protein
LITSAHWWGACTARERSIVMSYRSRRVEAAIYARDASLTDWLNLFSIYCCR